MEQVKPKSIEALQADILRLQGFKSTGTSPVDLGLGPIAAAFPNHSFPLGAVHELISCKVEDTAVTVGFIAGLLSSLIADQGTVVWISSSRRLFPPALKSVGIDPARFIFIDVKKECDVLWALEESLKCQALSAVVGEITNISFTESRRLQLVVEQSQVTGFLLHNSPRKLGTTACVSRWRITSLQSEQIDFVPGMTFPKWRVELMRIRNGRPGVWDLVWSEGKFSISKEKLSISQLHRRQAG